MTLALICAAVCALMYVLGYFRGHAHGHFNGRLYELRNLHDMRNLPPDIVRNPGAFPDNALWIAPNGDRYARHGDGWTKL